MTARKASPPTRPLTLAVDVGGTGIKALILDATAQPITERQRLETPRPAIPTAVLTVIRSLASSQGNFDRVSVGFPGVVKQGVVQTAPNLHPEWHGYPLAKQLEKALRKPVRVANDSGVQGYGVIERRGVEMVITLGTGFGSALFVDGRRVPNLELAHHPFRKQKTYEEELGIEALQAHGKKKWNARLAEALESLARTFNYDRLYIGGGNAEKVTLELPPNVRLVSNIAGLLGGVAIWDE
ncbi:MAG: ROK family protein [Acidobacteriota bacterium]